MLDSIIWSSENVHRLRHLYLHIRPVSRPSLCQEAGACTLPLIYASFIDVSPFRKKLTIRRETGAGLV